MGMINKSCNFLAPDVKEASVLFDPLLVRIKRKIRPYTFAVNARLNNYFYPKKISIEMEPLNLQPGEWVEVKSIEEIFQTLDNGKRYKGLFFMPDMENFCGKKFRVFKRVEIIKLEETGEVRKLKTPSVFLEGVFCNGEQHEGCDRACFHFWKEAWLRKISD